MISLVITCIITAMNLAIEILRFWQTEQGSRSLKMALDNQEQVGKWLKEQWDLGRAWFAEQSANGKLAGWLQGLAGGKNETWEAVKKVFGA